jgi:peptidoglycan/LPS O-acetylase OafA/YrhL
MAPELHGVGAVAIAATPSSALQPIPAPDLVLHGSPGDSRLIGWPCHRRAADWLRAEAVGGRWVGEGLEVDGRDVDNVIARAIGAGFTVALRYAADQRPHADPYPAVPERPTRDTAELPGGATYHAGLDGLRAVAVLAVMAFHLGWLPGGAAGVDIFFTLSGYLITKLLYTEYRATDTIALKAFFLRRGTRLLPALLLVTTVWFVILGIVVSPTAELALTAIAVVTYTVNWMMVAGRPLLEFFGHIWSLAVEEQFYVLWPLMLWFILARTRTDRAALRAVVGLTVLASLWRVSAFVLGGMPEVLYYRSDIRAETLLVGAVLAVLLHMESAPAIRLRLLALDRAGLLIIGLVMATVSPWSPFWYTGLGLVVSLGVAAIITRVVLTPTSAVAKFLSRPSLVRTGQISYGLYLWHLPVFIACKLWLPGGTYPLPLAHAVVGVALTFACAAASYRWLEAPCREAGRRLAARAKDRVVARPRTSCAPVPHCLRSGQSSTIS